MKTASIARWLILLSFGVLLLAADAHQEQFARPPEHGRQAWLLDLFKTLADSDGLADPDKVGAVLGVRFDKAVVTASPSHAERFAKSFERDEYTPTTATWFVAGPPGDASTGNWRPNGRNGFAAGVDPTARGDRVNFKYFQSKRFGLLEGNTLFAFDMVDNDSQVSILFYGIDKLTCITLKDVQARFPGIHHMGATDASAEQYLYYPPASEDDGAVLSFPAPAGQCVTEATIQDFSAFGKRHRRAEYKFVACKQEAAKAFCAQHRVDPAHASRETEEFNAYLHEKCLGLNTFYDREPSNHEDPPGPIDYAHVPWGCPNPGVER